MPAPVVSESVVRFIEQGTAGKNIGFAGGAEANA
jgi:hypothetical protein